MHFQLSGAMAAWHAAEREPELFCMPYTYFICSVYVWFAGANPSLP